MSDIIYTPPASGGGGTTINPTNNFIPVRSNATTFVDSFIFNDNSSNLAYSSPNLGGDVYGWYVDFTTGYTILGDFGGIFDGLTFNVDSDTSSIYSRKNGNDIGLNLDFANDTYKLGDYSGLNNGINLNIDDANNLIIASNGTNQSGMQLEFANRYYFFGNWNSGNLMRLYIDDLNKFLLLGSSNGDGSGYSYSYTGNGINNDFNMFLGCNPDGAGIYISDDLGTGGFGNVDIFSLGVIRLFSNNNQGTEIYANGTTQNNIILNPASDKMTFTTGALSFQGAGLQSPTAGGSAGQHLVITLNGIQYKIALLNP